MKNRRPEWVGVFLIPAFLVGCATSHRPHDITGGQGNTQSPSGNVLPDVLTNAPQTSFTTAFSSALPETSIASGTGFFITNDGYLITSYHIVKDRTRIQLLTSAGVVPAIVVEADEADDIALLKADGTFSALPLVTSRTVSMGDSVFTVGFPGPGLQKFAPKLGKGVIAALSGAKNDPIFFQISLPVQPGNSGGALVSADGNVIGIVLGKRDPATALAASDALPENVDLAIKSSFLLGYLESVPAVSAELIPPAPGARPFDDVVKQAENATALVLAY